MEKLDSHWRSSLVRKLPEQSSTELGAIWSGKRKVMDQCQKVGNKWFVPGRNESFLETNMRETSAKIMWNGEK